MLSTADSREDAADEQEVNNNQTMFGYTSTSAVDADRHQIFLRRRGQIRRADFVAKRARFYGDGSVEPVPVSRNCSAWAMPRRIMRKLSSSASSSEMSRWAAAAPSSASSFIRHSTSIRVGVLLLACFLQANLYTAKEALRSNNA